MAARILGQSGYHLSVEIDWDSLRVAGYAYGLVDAESFWDTEDQANASDIQALGVPAPAFRAIVRRVPYLDQFVRLLVEVARVSIAFHIINFLRTQPVLASNPRLEYSWNVDAESAVFDFICEAAQLDNAVNANAPLASIRHAQGHRRDGVRLPETQVAPPPRDPLILAAAVRARLQESISVPSNAWDLNTMRLGEGLETVSCVSLIREFCERRGIEVRNIQRDEEDDIIYVIRRHRPNIPNARIRSSIRAVRARERRLEFDAAFDVDIDGLGDPSPRLSLMVQPKRKQRTTLATPRPVEAARKKEKPVPPPAPQRRMRFRDNEE